MQVLQVCAYNADYSGNFIASLEALENKLAERNIQVIYAFTELAKEKEWCKNIQKRTRVYFLPLAKARILPKTYQMLKQIYDENDIGIVHSHFELYDMPAALMAPKYVKVFWHLHDTLDSVHGLRKLLWKLQYGVVGKRAHLLSVADYYRKVAINMGFPEKQTHTVLNGINLDRIKYAEDIDDKICKYDFLTFGWDFYRKGADLILKACDKLEEKGYSFKLLLNGNENTWTELDRYLQGREPSYLIKGDPVEDVNGLFAQSGMFIQASRRETFSYAVCEAAYFGLPVISSDIAGLEWAHDLPTVSFFNNEDIDALCQLMENYLKGESDFMKARLDTRQIITERYSLKVWAENILHYYGI